MMTRAPEISKRKLLAYALSPLLKLFLAVWAIVCSLLIIAAFTGALKPLYAMIAAAVLLIVFAVALLACAGQYKKSLPELERQEEWFGVSFDRELAGRTLRRGLYIDRDWYVALDGLRLYVFRQGYLVGLTDTETKDARGNTVLSAMSVCGEPVVLRFASGAGEQLSGFKRFVRG